MEKRIIFATGNEGKMREIRMILGDLGVPVVSMKEAGAAADIEENGTSFEENAIIKARTFMKKGSRVFTQRAIWAKILLMILKTRT